MAIKIDRLDSKKYTPDTATKAYIEVRAEVSILQTLKHAHVIEFVGVVLQPLCFVLEWAPMGGLSSTLKKYRKVDARIGPITLHETAYQVGQSEIWVGTASQIDMGENCPSDRYDICMAGYSFVCLKMCILDLQVHVLHRVIYISILHVP